MSEIGRSGQDVLGRQGVLCEGGSVCGQVVPGQRNQDSNRAPTLFFLKGSGNRAGSEDRKLLNDSGQKLTV